MAITLNPTSPAARLQELRLELEKVVGELSAATRESRELQHQLQTLSALSDGGNGPVAKLKAELAAVARRQAELSSKSARIMSEIQELLS